jgi:hypothetical protein
MTLSRKSNRNAETIHALATPPLNDPKASVKELERVMTMASPA